MCVWIWDSFLAPAVDRKKESTVYLKYSSFFASHKGIASRRAGSSTCTTVHAWNKNMVEPERAKKSMWDCEKCKHSNDQKIFILLVYFTRLPLHVRNLIPDSQANSHCLSLTGDVNTRERPVEDSYRTCEHTLDRLAGKRLGDWKLPGCHCLGTSNITPKDWRSNASRPKALHPTIGIEKHAIHVLRKKLNHIRPLWLAVDENVQAQGLLNANSKHNLLVNCSIVFLLGNGFFFNWLRSLRTSGVWGKDPIAVVGKRGTPLSWFSWRAFR